MQVESIGRDYTLHYEIVDIGDIRRPITRLRHIREVREWVREETIGLYKAQCAIVETTSAAGSKGG